MPANYRGLFLLLAVFLLQGVLPNVVRSSDASSAEDVIYVVSHGWHTGIVIRYTDIPSQLWPEKADFADSTYLEVGWGDEAFYRAPRATLAMALKAALGSKQTVLHVVGFNEAVVEFFPDSEIVSLRVPAQETADLVGFIHRSVMRPPGQPADPLGPGLYGNSWFYPAKGKYSLFYNCNHWVAEGLRRADVPMNVNAAMTSSGVMCQASRVGESIR